MLAEDLALGLYHSHQVGAMIKAYALLVPMLYCDAIVDAINKGLGQQRICVRYNIFTALLDVAGLYILLPKWGMAGYFASFFVSHAVNAMLSVGLLVRTSGVRLRLWSPAMVVLAMVSTIAVADRLTAWPAKCVVGLLLILSILTLTKVVGKTDAIWLGNLVKTENFSKKMKNNV